MALIEMKNIYKAFGGVVALQGVDFSVEDNEVVGLIGDNGAGKSTLIKILSGVFPPTKGEIYAKGQKIDLKAYSVKEARRLGIETVFQEQALGIKQVIWRNLFLGREVTNRLGFLDVPRARHEAQCMISDLLGFRGAGISTDSQVETLSGGERQGVAIGRAMYFEANLVILDEPTRALSVKEVNKILSFIRKLKECGKSCVYISHTIANIYSVSNRFVILDRGCVVAEYSKDEICEADLNEMLIHHASSSAY